MKAQAGSNKVVVLLRALAALSAVAIVACWISLGAHMGWSQTRIPVQRTDAVTATTFTDYEERFLPGLDFLVAGLLGSAAIFALPLVIPKSKGSNRR
ncbi:MAG TPA: hypothetical protein VIZ87_09245 [Terrimicrobium sp.]|jgi:hypothetical protein